MNDLFLGTPPQKTKEWIEDQYYLNTPFHIEAITSGRIYLGDIYYNLPPTNEISLIYSLDNENWNDWNYSTGTILKAGQKLYLKSKVEKQTFNSTTTDYRGLRFWGLPTTFYFNVCGNIMSLIYNDFSDKKELQKNQSFQHLFGTHYQTTTPNIINAKNLKLPATTIQERCYYAMFIGCSNMVSLPKELPALKMKRSCYSYMFYRCEKVKETTIRLDSVDLDYECYLAMFCKNSIEKPIELPADVLCTRCYYHMFESCPDLTATPNLSATQLADGCYQSMFNTCTNLKKASELPATVLKPQCYHEMFYDCTKLKGEMKLPATTLNNQCYYGMFTRDSNISALHYPATIENNSQFKSMTGVPWFGATNATVYYDL